MDQNSAPLPAGWAEHKDPSSGNPYYHNLSTGEVTWSKPLMPADGSSQAPPAQSFGGQQASQGLDQGYQQQQQQQQGISGFDQGLNSGAGGWGGAQQQGCGGGGGLLIGTVKIWAEDKGFGFITPSDGSEDIFVHRSTLTDGDSLVQGATVQYEAGWNDKKNKMNVTKLVGATGKGGGKGQAAMVGAAPVNAPPGCATGTVKHWTDEKGFGFITPSAGGDEVFVHRSTLQDGESLVVGSQVAYEAVWNPEKNKNSVTQCFGASPKGAGKGGGSFGGWGGQGGGGGQGGYGGSLAPSPDMMTGTVKMWYDEKGFGFIVPQGGGDDIFVHRNSLTDGTTLVQGSQVHFKMEMNAQKGKYEASQCIGASQGKGGKGKDGGWGNGKGWDQGKGYGQSGWGGNNKGQDRYQPYGGK